MQQVATHVSSKLLSLGINANAVGINEKEQTVNFTWRSIEGMYLFAAIMVIDMVENSILVAFNDKGRSVSNFFKYSESLQEACNVLKNFLQVE